MPKESKSAKGGTGVSKKTKTASKTAKKSRGAKKKVGSDSSNELEAVATKKGEPADNLRQRAQWFQKRHGG
jgi:hypothetical protein